MAEMQQALEQRQAGPFMAGVAQDFAGNGGMDRAALQQVVRVQVLAHTDIGLTLVGAPEVQVQGGHATVRFTVVATGGSGRVMPDQVRAWDVTSGWRDEDGQWRLNYAEWRSK